MRYLTILFLTAALASTASALTVSMNYLGPGETNQASGYVTTQIVIDTEGADWLSAQIIVEPTGGLLLNADGSEQSPTPFLLGLAPALAYDSYISSGVTGVACGTTNPTDLDLGATKVWTTSLASMGWFRDDTDDISSALIIAQLTIQTSASGTWALRVSTSDDSVYLQSEMGIVNGELIIPEPATMSLLALGGLGMLIRRRRR